MPALSRLKTLAETVYGTSESPVWLVTGLRGVSRQLQQPFESGADESLMHVPVWWREPSSAGTRLQSLCGSFDLLPTLAELLTTDGAASTAVAPEPLADGRLSLLSPQLQGTEGAAAAAQDLPRCLAGFPDITVLPAAAHRNSDRRGGRHG
ncbi:MAG UNVERIFIED_CONTAM: hypothetical protein LVR18_01830 [Planctomycetaceae bacterium]